MIFYNTNKEIIFFKKKKKIINVKLSSELLIIYNLHI
jgi:hypothetical protein